MAGIWNGIKRYLKQGDTLLLTLCILASVFGIVLISSAVKPFDDPSHYVKVQTIALILGIIMYIFFSTIDLELLCDRWKLLLIINVLAISSLFVFGVEGDSGNKSWISYAWMPFSIQPAEVVKLTFTLLMARQMYAYRERINAPSNIVKLLGHLMLMLGLILLSSRDAGMAIVYAVIFAFMAFSAGVSIPWFIAWIAAAAVALPLLWQTGVINDYQKDRIMIIFDPSIDPENLTIGWHAAQSKLALGGGMISGQGLGNGNITQSGSMFASHTDFIFSTAGEELGLVGCIVILAILTGIVACCFYRAVRCRRPMSAYICAGFAGMLAFQIFENIGMCLGIMPVIGLTLPFFSYGGSSLVTTFCCMGIVSGIRLKPPPVVPRY
ncbi:MAG: FtsW/RodA/SpoVE family cell cycle protein [Oscillospiraceae bacterium]|nr:FtsW/RodA/SpoVE family cell cycle protein [Oscillospiraceae bacterium]